MTKQYKRITWLMVGLWSILVLLVWFKPSEAYSESERRTLQQFPEISTQKIFSGAFMSDFEDYAADQFPFRSFLRTMKAETAMNIFGQSADHGIYVVDDYAVKMEYPLNEVGIRRAVQRFGYIYEKYMKDTEVQGYYAVIPDKNYFLADTAGALAMDYSQLSAQVDDGMKMFTKLDITDFLMIEDYYRTDIHWKQEKITDVAVYLLEQMVGTSNVSISEEDFVKLDVPFYGVYATQSAFSLKPDTIYYYENEQLKHCRVYDYEKEQSISVYDMEKAYGKDAYEIFLSGALPLITIENPEAKTDKALVLFRDSFGSSLAPLLIETYSQITLVDIRYIHPDRLENYMTFTNQDVLFLYSTSVLNHGETIQ